MGGMRLPQFTTKTLLLAVVVVAISIAGFLPWHRGVIGMNAIGLKVPPLQELDVYFYQGLLWVPWIFIAYSLGRGRLTVLAVVVFAIAESLAVGFYYWSQTVKW